MIKEWKLELKIDNREKRANFECLNIKYFETAFQKYNIDYKTVSLSLGDFIWICHVTFEDDE